MLWNQDVLYSTFYTKKPSRDNYGQKGFESGEGRSNSADQGFFSGNPSDGTNEYQSNTMSSMSSEENHQLYKLPASRRLSNEQTDTLSSVGSSVSSDLSSDSGVRSQALASAKRLRPNDLKKRVDKCKSDMTERASDRRQVVVEPTSYSMQTSQEDSTLPALPPKTYRTPPTPPHQSQAVPTTFSIYGDVPVCGPPPCRYYLYPDQNSMYRTYSDDSLQVSRNVIAYPPPTSDVLLATARPAHVDPRRMPLNRYTYLSPETERGIDWSNLVDAATKAIEGIQHKSQESMGESGRAVTPPTLSQQLKLEAAHQRIKLLEDKVDRLHEQLQKERDDKNRLELDLLNMRDENSRLDEECRTAKNELQKFSEWFIKAVGTKGYPGMEPPPYGLGQFPS